MLKYSMVRHNSQKNVVAMPQDIALATCILNDIRTVNLNYFATGSKLDNEDKK
jgi:hypothetical protein